MGVFWYPDPKTIQLGEIDPEVQRLDPDEVYFMLQRKPDVIPNNILVYDWKALDVTHENLEILSESHNYYFTGKGENLTSLSYGCFLQRGELPLWAFTIYSNETDAFYAQLENNLTCACVCKKTALMGTYQIKFEKVLHQVDWISEDHWGTRLVLLEKTLR
jgi:hypothetical protein